MLSLISMDSELRCEHVTAGHNQPQANITIKFFEMQKVHIILQDPVSPKKM